MIVNIIVVVFIILVINKSHADEDIDFNNYFGFGVGGTFSNIKFQDKYGDNMFAKSAKGINIFVVAMFNDALGVEIGCNVEKKRRNSVMLHSNEYVAGFLNWGDSIVDSEIKQRHSYLGIILNSDINDRWLASTLLGVSMYNIHARYSILWPIFFTGYTATFSKTKPIITARFSVEYKLTSKFVIKTSVAWRNTARVTVKSPDTSLGNLLKLKNSYNAGLGFACYI